MPFWYRVGHLVKPIAIPGGGVRYKVTFKNLDSPKIKAIEICHSKKFGTHFTLIGTEFAKSELHSLVEKYFSFDEYKTDKDDIIKFNSKYAYEKIIKLLRAANQYYESEIITKQIFFELKQIADFIFEKKEFEHIISEGLIATPHPNPERENSTALIHFINYYTHNDLQIKKFKKLLVAGENPNQRDFMGVTLLWLAIMKTVGKNRVDIVKILFCYGCDPYDRNNFFSSSAIEKAKEFQPQDPEIFNVIIAAVTVVERPLKSMTKVIHLKMYNDQKDIVTLFEFSDGKRITNKLRKTSDLTVDEKQIVFKEFNHEFEVPGNVEKLKEIFTEEISGKNKYIQLIYDNELIGFNLFEIVFLKEEMKVCLNSMYSILQRPYRGYGLISLIAFAPAYGLQLLLGEKYTTPIFFLSDQFNSDKLAHGNLRFPMYQTPEQVKTVHELLKHSFKGNYRYFHDATMTFYVEEELRVQGPNYTQTNNLLEEFFYNEMLNIKDKNDKKTTRSVPELFYVGRENFSILNFIATNLAINFYWYIWTLAECMFKSTQFLPHKMANKPKDFNAVKRPTNLLFWGKQGSSPTNDQIHSQSLRTKL